MDNKIGSIDNDGNMTSNGMDDFNDMTSPTSNDDMTGYVDTLQDEEECLDDGELYVVLYHQAIFESGRWNIDQLVDFGITKEQIIENVKNQKYVEGASYFTIGQMYFATTQVLKNDSWL